MAEAINDALEKVYAALHDNNTGLDEAIAALKQVLEAHAQKSVTMVPTRLPQNNRQGRKMLQTYFKKRGVTVEYTK